jgi:hypothetical protein
MRGHLGGATGLALCLFSLVCGCTGGSEQEAGGDVDARLQPDDRAGPEGRVLQDLGELDGHTDGTEEDNCGCPAGSQCTPTGCKAAADGFKNPANWSAFNAGKTDGLSPRGYFGVINDGRYLYFVPCRDQAFHGRVLRYDTQASFTAQASYSAYDAGKTDGLTTIGYGGGTFDGRYVYFAPFSDGARHGKVLRYDTQGDFKSASGWSAYDAGATDGLDAKGFVDAVFDGRYVYFVPFGYEPVAHGNVLRYDTQGDFKTAASWNAYDAGNTGGMLTIGYYGLGFDNRYIYFAPFNDGQAFHGRVLRYDTEADFKTPSSWAAHDAGNTSGLVTTGYKGGAYDGRYIYFVPFRDDVANHGRVLRYDTLSDFSSAGSWTAKEAGNVDGLSTKGFVGAVMDDRYVYFIPYQEGEIYHARAMRYDTLASFQADSSWSAFEPKNTGGMNTQGYKMGAFDGQYIYYTPYHNGSFPHGMVLRFDTEGP